MKRRETYATTGPRMVVRFFGGWDFEAGDANNRMPARIGYTKGVPMGGDLSNAPAGKSPTFLVAALKDPIGANLDRIQIIKGWLGKDGQTQERIYDVAVSGGRKIDADGRSRTSVGSTVDVANATWTNTIGAGEMITVWKDPEFDPALRAFYYVRVIEIPTPRWTAYDAKYFGVKMPTGSPDDHDRTRLYITDLVHALISRLLREPLLQFLVLGAILFALYSLVDKRGVEAPEKIVVSAARIANLADGFSRTWRRPPSKEELQNLIENYVRDEVFYRAGRAAGLDRDDVVIRRRVRQKMEFLAEEISAPEPSEGELASFLAANPDRFRTEDRLSFHHVFLSPSRRAETIDAGLEASRGRSFGRAAPADDMRGLAIRSCSVRSSMPFRRET